jgi:hypothetical protein
MNERDDEDEIKEESFVKMNSFQLFTLLIFIYFVVMSHWLFSTQMLDKNGKLNLQRYDDDLPIVKKQRRINKEGKPEKIFERFGRTCNRIVALAYALEQAREEGFVLLIKTTLNLLDKLDMELFEEYFRGLYRIVDPEEEEIDGESLLGAHTYWCGAKTISHAIRYGIRPLKPYREFAEEEFRKIKALSDNATIMSVHIRHYDGLCEEPVPNSCEWRRGYEFQPQPFGCNQTLTASYLKWILDDWPEYPWDQKKLNIFLSTDRQVKSIDQSYLDSTTRLAMVNDVFEPQMEITKWVQEKNEYTKTSELFIDLWMSVLTDFHVAMPLSSCDKIVAEWRSALRKAESVDTVHPRKCYGEYFYGKPQKPQCVHTRFLGLDTYGLSSTTSPNDICRFILSLSVAFEKAKEHHMGLHLYGEWGKFAENYLDMDEMKKHLVVHIMDRQEPLLYLRLHVPHESKMRGSGVIATEQSECAKGEFIKALTSLKIRPSKKIRDEASEKTEELRRGDSYHYSTEIEKGNNACYCFQSQGCNSTKYYAGHPDSSSSYIKTLWEHALAGKYYGNADSPCSQIVALWRYGLRSGRTYPIPCFTIHPETETGSGWLTDVTEFEGNDYWLCP